MAGYPGRQGRKPVPTAIKLLRGNPGKRPLNSREAAPPVAVPACPGHLATEAKREWRRTGRQLAQHGLLTVIDRAAFAAYCQAWARWLDAEDKLREFGVVIKGAKGGLVPSPYLRIAEVAIHQMHKLLVEFGMTPSARSRIAAAPREDSADDVRFFGVG